MSLKVKQGGVFTDVGGGGDMPDPWVRPSDWLALPTVEETDKKFVGLYAVYDTDSNFVTITAAGAYTVDWGDGSAPENFASNNAASHTFTYSSIPSNTVTTEGYRQVIITVTPQGAGAFTLLNISNEPTITSALTGLNSGWLDCLGAGNLSTLTVVGTTSVVSTVRPRNMQRFRWLGTLSIGFAGNMFYGCTSLRVVELDTSAATSMSGMFTLCVSLQTVPLLNTSNATNITSMFNSCYSLRTIPLLDTSSATTMGSMFSNCLSLQEVPLLDTGNATTMASMFQSCTSLTTIPLLNTSNVLNMNLMFEGCDSLTTIPLLDTSSATDFGSMFSNCYSLQTVPLLNAANVTVMSSMFDSCFSLQTVPLLNTSNATTMSNMFNACYSLQTVPLLDTSKATTVASMFNLCSSLRSVPALDVGRATTLSGMFTSCPSLAKSDIREARAAISYASCSLSAAELNRIYTNLPANTNLLSADAASVETSANDWNVNTTNCNVTRSANTSGEGTQCLTLTSITSGLVESRLTTRIAVTPGTTYTGMAYAITTVRTRRVKLAWYDSGGTLLSTDAGPDSSSGAGFRIVTAAAPANAATVSLVLSHDATASGAGFNWDCMGINPGTETRWMRAGLVVTVTGNYGVSGDDPSIATEKGWTVTG